MPPTKFLRELRAAGIDLEPTPRAQVEIAIGDRVGAGKVPRKISIHSGGRSAPATQARVKKGRKPTSHRGCRKKFIASLS